jgi:hypothetical protein
MHNLCVRILHGPPYSMAFHARNFFKTGRPFFILGIINSESQGLPWQMAAVRFFAGQPSSALPDTDGRHDRTGHGTWMLLAVFVAHDCRPWLSVTGTYARVSACAPGMDPRACDGRTTVCPLWLLGAAVCILRFGQRSIRRYRRAPSNFLILNCSASTPSRQRTLSITMSRPPGPLP